MNQEKIVTVSPSVGYTNRALIIKALSKNPVKIINPSESLDCKILSRCLEDLDSDIWDVKNSEETFRFLTSVACLIPGEKIIKSNKNISIGELVGALQDLGAQIEYLGENGFSPIRIKSSKLRSGNTRMHGEMSSQYFSSLLMIGPLIGGVTIEVMGEQNSRGFIDMTLDIMEKFGGKVSNLGYKKYVVPQGEYRLDEYERSSTAYKVEGDFLEADYFIADALVNKSKIILRNLNRESMQGYAKFLKILEEMGNEVRYEEDEIVFSGRKFIPSKINLENCPLMIEVVAFIAAGVNGETVIAGIRNLRIKDVGSILKIQDELARLGIKSESSLNTLTIYGESHKFSALEVSRKINRLRLSKLG